MYHSPTFSNLGSCSSLRENSNTTNRVFFCVSSSETSTDGIDGIVISTVAQAKTIVVLYIYTVNEVLTREGE
jgi:hypothetical protein